MEVSERGASGNEPTIADVAEAAKTSIRTVSRVLNDSPKVNEETRERVKRAIALLNFRPSPRARALAMGRSLLIGMLHNDRNALVLDTVQRGIGGEATRRGYELITHSVDLGGDEAIADVLAFARRTRIDGLVVLPPVSGIIGLPEALKAENIHAVAVSAVHLDGYPAVVLSHERKAAGDVAKYLIELGHDNIALINGPQDMISARERRSGFLEALDASGITPAMEVEGDYTLASGRAAAEEILSRTSLPTAVFAANDIMAAGVLKIAAEKGIRVPDDLSVVGFDGSVLAEMLIPSLSTVSRPFGKMAELATSHLLNLIEGKPLKTDSPPLGLTLLPSRSSGPATPKRHSEK
ncbi:LacI family transcriptional regulator [Novosphingobium sp. PhB165]|uniref:LacI family DNA-binding transcriptional regulator n=1 Tax=Novosphingobium sp. PhB165 TaxID=2485105 RepID=UPI00104E5D0E|nr:LacI family DNA-binding transcriptional regulator [Novosphingobium sp. PhB165]TCM16110.1 LacI family transcriptional regulator [Novosphingobium sp. PhB165]